MQDATPYSRRGAGMVPTVRICFVPRCWPPEIGISISELIQSLKGTFGSRSERKGGEMSDGPWIVGPNGLRAYERYGGFLQGRPLSSEEQSYDATCREIDRLEGLIGGMSVGLFST